MFTQACIKEAGGALKPGVGLSGNVEIGGTDARITNIALCGPPTKVATPGRLRAPVSTGD